MNYVLKNWKTSAAGLAMLLDALGDILNSLSAGNGISNADLVSLVASFGLFAAKDGNVTGAVKPALAALIALPALLFSVPAMAADLPPVRAQAITKAPIVSGVAAGPYFGVGTYLETTQAQFSVGGTNLSSNADTGSLGGIFGYAFPVGQNWVAFDGAAYWQNLNNSGTVCAVVNACVKSNFSATAFVEVGIPPGLNMLPNITNLFPGFNSGGAAANMYPYLGVGAHFDDVSASVMQSNGRDWLIPFAARAGVKTKMTNGTVFDIWGDITFKGSGFSVGAVGVNQANTYRVGTSILLTGM